MDRQSGCQLSNRAGTRVWGGGACPTRSRESEGAPGRPQAQAGAAWRLLEASQAEPVGPRDVEWAGCRQAGSVLARVPAAAGIQARLPRERAHPGAFRAQGSWRAVCCPLCEPTGAVWKGDPAAPRCPRAHPLRVLLFSFRPTPTCRLSLGAPLITGEKKRCSSGRAAAGAAEGGVFLVLSSEPAGQTCAHGGCSVIVTEGPEAAELPFPELQSSRPDSGHSSYRFPRLTPGRRVLRVQRAGPEPRSFPPGWKEGGQRKIHRRTHASPW